MNDLSDQFNEWWEIAIEKNPEKIRQHSAKNDEDVNRFLSEYNSKSLIEKLKIIHQFIDESVVYSGQNNDKMIKDQITFQLAIVLLGKLIFEPSTKLSIEDNQT